MDTPPLHQRLAAILAADAVGYSRLMSTDERATVAALDKARLVFREDVASNGGRVIDTAGDSVLASFATATGAVKAALAIQRRLEAEARAVSIERRMHFRIGIHLGDVFEKDDGSMYGDGVNIASRLEGLAEPGGIVVSQSVRMAIHGRVSIDFEDRGDERVKNIAEPVRAYSLVATRDRSVGRRMRIAWDRYRATLVAIVALAVVGGSAVGWWSHQHRATLDAASIGASRAQSIAVLAFANLGGDKANDYFSDGISEELLNTLGLVPSLTVIGRTSSFQFRNATISLPEIGHQLGVAYLVEGSVQRQEQRVRIGARLVRAADGVTIWSQSYDRALDDVLSVETEMAVAIAQKLQLQIRREELANNRASNAEAQRLSFEAAQFIFEHTPESYDRAEALLKQALVIDPAFNKARAVLANIAWNRLHDAGWFTFGNRNSSEYQRIVDELDRVLATTPDLIEARAQLASLRFTNWDVAASLRETSRALQLNPNHSSALLYESIELAADGRMSDSMVSLKRLVDIDPLRAITSLRYADALNRSGDPAAALPYVDRVLAIQPRSASALKVKAEVMTDLGRHADAIALAHQVRAMEGQRPRTAVWQLLVASGGSSGRKEVEAHLASLADAPASPRAAFRRVQPELALGRANDALRDLGAAEDLLVDDLFDLFYNPGWDPVRDSPRFQQLIERVGMRDAHARAQSWRAAHPRSSAVKAG